MSDGFFGRLVRRTSVEALQADGHRSGLRRALRGRDLIAIGLGSMIGGGIFTTIGPGVAKAGPAIIIAFVLAGLASLFAALCYAELGSMVPIAGSAYTYAYATLGQLVAWIIGWDLILEYGVSAAPVAAAFSSSVQVAANSLWHVALPVWARTAHWEHAGPWWAIWSFDPSRTTVDVIGALFVLALSVLLVIGIRETATGNNIFVVLKIAALVVFVAVGLTLFRPANLVPFAPLGWGTLGFGAGGNGIVPAAALVFFIFIGFDAATTTAEETRDPKVDVPVGVLGSLGIGTLIYCTVALVLVGAVPWQHVDQNAALLSALAPLHSPLLDAIITVGVIAGTTSVALTSLLGQSRIFYVMARDRMLPPAVAAVDPRFKTPARMTLITGVIVALLAFVVPLDALLELVNIGTFSAFIIVCAGVIWLRFKRPELPRPFRSPLVPLFPLCGIALSLFLSTVGLGPFTWLRFIVWLAVGLVIYFLYGHRQPVPGAR
ncbi:MAG: amino acid permease [Candidatus Lustribacter sp.]|jgi:APA family basic amino acid/polyamine antiporter